MSEYYRAQRVRNLYVRTKHPYRLSRTKLDLFIKCPRCFYLDRRLGVGQPPSYPFSLNSAVDELLKCEFDRYRLRGEPHPMMVEAGIKAVPFAHPDIEQWRNSLSGGVQYLEPTTNFLITGGVDDVWVDARNQLIVVDYKATSKDEEVSLDKDWQIGYMRQVEIYQWLFRKNGFKVSDVAYFVYANGDRRKKDFKNKLHFETKILPYTGDTSWIEGAVQHAFECLNSDSIPPADDDCDYCSYRSAAHKYEVRLHCD